MQVLLLVSADAIAQRKKGYHPLDFGGTDNTLFDPEIPDETEKPRKPRSFYLVLKSTKGTLYGNKCIEEVTYSMGFKFLVQPYGNIGYRSEVGRVLHNFFTRILLTFRNGPFWYFRLKRKIEECKEFSGDFVG